MARKNLTKAQRQQLAEQRRAKVIELRDRLGQWQENTDPAIVAAIIAQYSDYSPRNAQLIAMQMPEATEVHGFTDWHDYGRQVKKRPADVAPGEYGIKILAPAGKTLVSDGDPDYGAKPEQHDVTEDKPRERQLFRIAYVYDRSQTEPLKPRPRSLKRYNPLLDSKGRT